MYGSTFGEAVSIGYFGRRCDHLDNFLYLMEAAGGRPWVIEESLSNGLGGATSFGRLWKKVSRVGGQLWGTRNRRFVDGVLEALDEHRARCLVVYWGTQPLGDVISI